MLATESVRLASQAAMFQQQPTGAAAAAATAADNNAASAAASCFYKHKIINELKAGAQRARASRLVFLSAYFKLKSRFMYGVYFLSCNCMIC